MTTLENNITNLENNIFKSNFDISSSFLPDNEIAKNIIRSGSPGMSKEDVDIMVDGYVNGLTSSVTNDETKVSDFAKNNHIYPLHSNSQYYTQVHKIKTEVRSAVMMLVKAQKDLTQDIVKISIQISTSIAGATVLISPLSFNVPAAISLVLLVVDSISKITDKLMGVVQYTDPLKNLKYLLPSGSYDKITAPINTAISFLNSLLSAVGSLEKTATNLVNSMIGKINPKNLTSQISSLTSQLDSANSTLKNLTSLNKQKKTVGTPQQISDQKEIIDELTNRLNNMKSGYSIPTMTNGMFSEESASSFLNTITPTMTSMTAAANQLVNYVYDVVLPDGTILKDIDDNALEVIKSKYNVIFTN